ncbi:hypothetical protein BGZ73_001039 [Actinomortierella ambigua]|nr:hypothetical protein BGZ73_001039 [Actinomortierella ambigua]
MPAISSTATKPTTITDAAAAKQAYQPTHPGLFEVVYSEGSYNSRLVASRAYSKGEIICKVEGTTPGPKKYTSVQVSKTEHIELNSDLVFMNHSCNPTVNLNTDDMTIVAVQDVKEGKSTFPPSFPLIPAPVLSHTREDLGTGTKHFKSDSSSPGDSLTFFYPSSEWEMDQPFPCWCGDDKCVKQIQGAKFLSKEVMSRYWTACHIKDLLDERDAVAETSVSA